MPMRRTAFPFHLAIIVMIAVFGHACSSVAKRDQALAKLPGLVDLEGREVDPFAGGEPARVVFIFVRHDCPISNRYAPLLNRLHSRYAPRGIRFWMVHADPEVSVDVIRAHREEYALELPVLRDTRQSLVRASKASVTPEATVFVSGKQVYRGRIDDRYVDFGKERASPGRHDLEEALQNVLEGRPVQVPVTRAVGCYIPAMR